jgi:hypothetical protein
MSNFSRYNSKRTSYASYKRINPYSIIITQSSPLIILLESILFISALVRSIETLSTLLPLSAYDPNIVYVKNKIYRRNLLVRNKRPRTGWY